MKKIMLLAVLFSMLASQTLASTCYTPDQFRAEQAIRFHTQFMLIGMLCRNAYGTDSYASYQRFSERNQGVISAEENRLIGYFASQQGDNPEVSLHTLRTKIANDYSMMAMKMAGRFCPGMVKSYQAASLMQPVDFQGWIDKSAKKRADSTRPLCAVAQRKK